MRGQDHALFGLAAYEGALLLGHAKFNLDWPGALTLGIGAAAAIGAGLAADIDEKHSISSQGAGLFGALARVITSAAGGHRTVTHYPLLWVGGLSLLCWGLIGGGVSGTWLGVTLGIFVALGFPFLIGPKRRSHLGPLLDVLTIAVAVGTWWLVQHYGVTAGWWLFAALPVPYLAHMVGDTPTPQGVPWLFPLSRRRLGFNLFHSGGSFETTVITPLLIIACAAGAWYLVAGGAFSAMHL